MLSAIPVAVVCVLTLHCLAVAKAGCNSFCFSALKQKTKHSLAKNNLFLSTWKRFAEKFQLLTNESNRLKKKYIYICICYVCLVSDCIMILYVNAVGCLNNQHNCFSSV